MSEFTELEIWLAAKTAHEVNRAYTAGLGDKPTDISQLSWEDSPDWQHATVLNGVRGVIAGNTPEQSHESWLAEKRATGWKYGPVKKVVEKEHPCFVPYGELPPAQRYKDILFVTTVRGVLGI